MLLRAEGSKSDPKVVPSIYNYWYYTTLFFSNREENVNISGTTSLVKEGLYDISNQQYSNK